jgi:hypothetical protein
VRYRSRRADDVGCGFGFVDRHWIGGCTVLLGQEGIII